MPPIADSRAAGGVEPECIRLTSFVRKLSLPLQVQYLLAGLDSDRTIA